MDLATLDEVALSGLERCILVRPNATRVMRLVRELPYVDSRLRTSTSLRAAEEFPRVTASLAAATGLAALLAFGADF